MIRSAEGERELAVAAREQAEEQTKRVEAAIADTEQKAKEASEYLEELKKRATVAHGSIWYVLGCVFVCLKSCLMCCAQVDAKRNHRGQEVPAALQAVNILITECE